MKAILATLCLLVAATAAISASITLPAVAFLLGGGGGGSSPSCSRVNPLAGAGVDDGCSGAGVYVNSDLSFYAPMTIGSVWTNTTSGFFQSGQTPGRPVQASWNMAGEDYPVGVTTLAGPYTGGAYCNGSTVPCSGSPGASGLIDAFAYSWPNNAFGCPHWTKASGSTATFILWECFNYPNGTNINLEGIDFTPISGGVQTEVNVLFDGSPSGGDTVTVKNSRIFSQYQSSVASGIIGNTSTTHVENLIVVNNRIDGGMAALGNNPLGATGNIFNWISNGTESFKYNYFTNIPRIIAGAEGCSHEFNYNVINGLGGNDVGVYGAPIHSEFYQVNALSSGAGCPGGVLAYFNAIDNTMWLNVGQLASEVVFFFDQQVGGPSSGTANVTAAINALNVGVAQQPQVGGQRNWGISGAASGAGQGGTYPSRAYPANGGGVNYDVGDILTVSLPSGCPMGSTTPTFIVWTNASGAGVPSASKIIYPFTTGTCVTNSQPPGTAIGGVSTTCVDHVTSAGAFLGACTSPSASGAILGYSWDSSQISNGMFTFSQQLDQYYGSLIIDYNIISFAIGSSGSLIPSDSGFLTYCTTGNPNAHNYDMVAGTYFTTLNQIDASCM